MKILPEARGARIRCGILICIVLGLVGYFRLDRLALYSLSAKAEGDLLFQSLPHGELVEAIETITESPWSHCGILVRQDDQWFVAESIGYVRYTPLYLWVLRGRGSRVDAFRVKDFARLGMPRLTSELRKVEGRPYDYRYAPDDKEIYCSELIYKAFDRAYQLKIGTWEKFGSLNWKPKEEFIRYMENGELPLDREMITPVGLTRSPLVYRVY